MVPVRRTSFESVHPLFAFSLISKLHFKLLSVKRFSSIRSID